MSVVKSFTMLCFMGFHKQIKKLLENVTWTLAFCCIIRHVISNPGTRSPDSFLVLFCGKICSCTQLGLFQNYDARLLIRLLDSP